MARLLPAILVALATLFAAPHALACDCKTSSVETEHDAVFLGEVTRVRQGRNDIATLEVERIIRGSVPRLVEISTPGSRASCGAKFVRGGEYYIFAAQSGDQWTTNHCMGTERRAEPQLDERALRASDLPADKIAAIKKLKAMGQQHAEPPGGAESAFDVSPPEAGYDAQERPMSVRHLHEVLRRPNHLRPISEARDLADKYLPVIYEESPPPSKYDDDARRILEAFYEAGDCDSIEVHADRLYDYIGPFEVEVDRWKTHCALLQGDFADAHANAENLDKRVGWDERTDSMLLHLATFAKAGGAPVTGEADFAEYLSQTEGVEFSSKTQKLEVVSTLVDLLGDTQLIRSPMVLTATADVVESLDDSTDGARRARALAYLRAAKLTEDDRKKEKLTKLARESSGVSQETLEALETLVFDELPSQRPDIEEAGSETPPDRVTDAHEKAKTPATDEEKVDADAATIPKDLLILGAALLGFIALVLLGLALTSGGNED